MKNNLVRQFFGTLNVNLFNLFLRFLGTFILGDLLGLEYRVYYPVLLVFLIGIGYYLHSRLIFKSTSRSSAAKYVLHLIFFNFIDYVIFDFLVLKFSLYQSLASLAVTFILYFFRFFSLRIFVFNNLKDSLNSKETSSEDSRALYNRIASNYDSFHDDKYSQLYYSKIISRNIISNEFNEKKVLEAMCGSGTQFTNELSKLNIDLTVLDISDEFIKIVKEKLPNINAVRSSLFDYKEEEKFDIICIIGGLHEVHPNVDKFMTKIHNLLKIDGKLFLMEPHSNSFINLFRIIWYRFDNNFNKNEKAISVSNLIKNNESLFDLKKVNYYGFLGYLFILQSGNFKIPFWLKKFYSPLLLKTEPVFNFLLPKFLKSFCIMEFQSK